MDTATVTCLCGKAALTFANAAPRGHSECACSDCRQKLEWCTKVGGRPWSPSLCHLWYLEDDVVGVRGEEHLRQFALREPTQVHPLTGASINSPFVVATCCHSVLAVPADYYNG